MTHRSTVDVPLGTDEDHFKLLDIWGCTRQKVFSSCGFIVAKAIVVKVTVIPGVLLQSPLKSAIMAPLNPGSLWVGFPVVGWYWSNLGLQSSPQKCLSLRFPFSPGTYKRRHNQHLESFLRSVDEKDSLRARYYSAITRQVSGLQSLCYGEELAALDVCMNPFTSPFMLWWWSFPFGTKNLLWSVFDQAQWMPASPLLLLCLNASVMP